MATFNTYLDPFAYRRASTGLDTTSLVALLTRLSSGVVLGATSLPVPALSAALASGERVTIFDGSLSEVVTLTANASVAATSLTVTATAAAHASGTVICSDGTDGSLSDLIVQASANIDSICLQSLYQATYENEKLRVPSMRAAISEADQQIIFRPRHFPVTAVSAVSLKTSSSTETVYDASLVIIDAGEQIASLDVYVSWSPRSLPRPATLQISYTAGYTAAGLPGDVKAAAVLLVSDDLARAENPTRAIEYQIGKKRLRFSELQKESQLLCEAKDKLKNYVVKAF